jgi:hypothetical protein
MRNMRICFKTAASILIVLLLASLLGACGKKPAVVGTASSKTATASKTISKLTTKKSSTSQGTDTTAKDNTDAAGQKENDMNGNDQETENIGSEDGESQEEFQSYFSKNIDLNGRTITVGVYWAEAIPALGRSKAGDIAYRNIGYIENKYNCKIVYEMKADNAVTFQTDFTNATMAGIKYADVITTQALITFPYMITRNLILAVDDYIDLTDPFWGNGGRTVEWGGKHYGSPNTNTSGNPNSCVFFNRDFISNNGLPDPQEIADTGNWNWDTFLNLAVMATRDINGDGILDQWGIESNNSYISEGILVSNDAYYTKVNKNGDVIYDLDSRNAINALEFMKNLTFVYKVLVKFPSLTNLYFTKGKSAMLIAPWSINYRYCRGLMKLGSVGYAPLPMGPDTDHFGSHATNSTFYAYPILLEGPGDVITIMSDLMAGWDQAKPEATPEGDTSAMLFYLDTMRDVDWFFKVAENTTCEFYQGFTDFKTIILNELVNPIWLGQVPVGTAVESVKQKAQDAINGQMH